MIFFNIKKKISMFKEIRKIKKLKILFYKLLITIFFGKFFSLKQEFLK